MAVSHVAKILSEGNLQRCRSVLHDAFVSFKPTDEKEKRRASILIPLCYYQDRPSILFVRRPLWMRKHAGEIAFPGGGVEAKDTSIGAAALRETNEELGITLQPTAILGALPISIPNKDGTYLVSCVLAYIGSVDRPNHHESPDARTAPHILKPHRGEIDDIYIVPIQKFIGTERLSTFRLQSRDAKRPRSWTSPCYIVRSKESPSSSINIWGLTGFMLREAFRTIVPEK